MRTSTRRHFIARGLTAGAAAVVLPLEALARRRWHDSIAASDPGYGPLRPVPDATTGLPLLELPDGFRYLSMGWTGDQLEGGAPTPAGHDGMAAFAGSDGLVRLIRNHELSAGPAIDATRAYDAFAGGGTTTLTFDPAAERLVAARVSLAGTLRNCAGGPTPWGTWLTCEETVLGPDGDPRLRRPHGYVFEVPVSGEASRTPLVALGRFVHEAVAVDPATGVVYQTEDANPAGLYRFMPAVARQLDRGGSLQMLAVRGRPRADLRRGHVTGVVLGTHWVEIGDPGSGSPRRGPRESVSSYGRRAGGAMFARLEGACYADGRVYVTSTSGGNATTGQVWELTPAADELRLIYESPGRHELDMPDNLTVSPRGGLVLCEDGTRNPCMHVLTRDGRIAPFARNAVVLRGERRGLRGDFRASEFAGATFSPDGRWLFVNVQTPGITLAITGPWERGPA